MFRMNNSTSGAASAALTASGAKLEYGNTYVKNYSILHISGADVGNNWFFGKDYEVEFVEFKPQD